MYEVIIDKKIFEKVNWIYVGNRDIIGWNINIVEYSESKGGCILKNILFVCIGNMCCSFMVEVLFKVKEIDGINVKFVGVFVLNGSEVFVYV